MSSARAGRAVTLLFTCVGRRIELMQAFRAAAGKLGVELRIVAIDKDASAPGLVCADHAELVPSVSDGSYIDTVESAIRKYSADLLIPTTDTDLPILSAHRARLIATGCKPLIGTADVIDTCRDKLKTFAFLRRIGVDTPTTYSPDEIRTVAQRRFPYFVKPRFGSASESTHVIADETDLTYFLQKGRDPIIQEFVAGREFTLDVYVGLSGAPRCVVPRLRMQVRSGEVSKGVVVMDQAIVDAGRGVVQALGGELRGIVTLQCICTDAGAIRFIEINPRFGGGAPLSIAAGADFPLWLLQEQLGQPPVIEPATFAHGLCMERYDWSVFVPYGADLRPRLAKPLRGFPPFA